MTVKLRLAIGDLSLRQALCGIFEQEPDLVVLPPTPSAGELGADLVLVDGEANAAAAAELIRSLKGTQPRTRAMMVVGQPTNDNVQAALSAGAAGVVSRAQSPRELLGAVRVVAQGGSYVCFAVASGSRSSTP